MSIFNSINNTKVKSNTFNLSHDRKLSLKFGKLIPVLCTDLVPGDKFSINSAIFMRFAPLVAPIMHRINVYMHFYYVPNRLVWDNWEDFITGGHLGNADPAPPTLNVPLQSVSNGSLFDHMGLPVSQDVDISGLQSTKFSALPFAMYNMIWNDYYRDQNLQEEIDYKLQDGDQDPSFNATILERAWQQDYFTSALPWTQKGPEAMLPLGEFSLEHDPDGGPSWMQSKDGEWSIGTFSPEVIGNGLIDYLPLKTDGSKEQQIDVTRHTNVVSEAQAASINDLRRAFKLQEWLEKNARGGSRYIESIAVHFGVKSSDQRLQRPEYLGGSKSPVKISEVLQNSETDATPQGNMAGHGISLGNSDDINYRAEEHGYIIGIMSVMPESAYQQGIPRHFLRQDRFDYYWPEFAHIGEQAILNKEIYQDEDDQDEVFGYAPRYSEYKFINSSVHGDFRSTLDFWHLSRKFASQPNLNHNFIRMQSQEAERIFAVQDGTDYLWTHVYHDIKAKRKMPYFGTPKM